MPALFEAIPHDHRVLEDRSHHFPQSHSPRPQRRMPSSKGLNVAANSHEWLGVYSHTDGTSKFLSKSQVSVRLKLSWNREILIQQRPSTSILEYVEASVHGGLNQMHKIIEDSGDSERPSPLAPCLLPLKSSHWPPCQFVGQEDDLAHFSVNLHQGDDSPHSWAKFSENEPWSTSPVRLLPMRPRWDLRATRYSTLSLAQVTQNTWRSPRSAR